MRTTGMVLVAVALLGSPALTALARSQTPPSGPPAIPNPAGQAAASRPAGPDPELRGLNALGVVVEELGSQAAACGLGQAPVEAAVTRSLTEAGLKALRNADEDTYVYVQIMTTSASSGLCVSRYDVFLYSFVSATLSYQVAPALVLVSLLRTGGLTGGVPAAHGEAVIRGVKQYVDEFGARIKAANR